MAELTTNPQQGMRYLRQPKTRRPKGYVEIKRGKRGRVVLSQLELDSLILEAVRQALSWMGKSHPDSSRTISAKRKSAARKAAEQQRLK